MCIKRFRNNTRSTFIVTSIMLATGLLVNTSAVASGIYKWVDEQGQVHYGEQPIGQDAEKMTIRTNETTTPRKIDTGESTEQKDGGEDQVDENGLKPWEKLVEKEIPAAEKRRLCNEARSDIEAISSRGRMREIDAKGNYTYLSEEQRQQRLSAARSKQKKYCR